MSEVPIMSVSSDVQLQNAQLPMVRTELGMVRDWRLLHPSKATLPMEVTEEPICTVSRPLQL